MEKLAIIGTGISGMGCAHFLHRAFDITLFEQNGYIGGHSNTVTVLEPETEHQLPIDTGFMVFNRVTYPLLTRLFEELDVPVKPTDMSFSVRDHLSGLEWCGTSLNHLFAQRRNVFNPRFIRMLTKINRFNKEALAALEDPEISRLTLDQYVKLRGYGQDFFDLYLVPMSSAVWSAPPELILTFPAAALLRFFHNHGFFGLNTQHPWWTVDGGAREYVNRLTQPWRDRIHLKDGVVRVSRNRGRVQLTTFKGEKLEFDRVVFANHADQALGLLDDPTMAEQRLLGAFDYQKNIATLHTDIEVLPKTRRARASWNYEIARTRDGRCSPATHYWMNRLQGVSERENYFVSINRPEAIAQDKILRQINYQHPLFNLPAMQAQEGLPGLNQQAQGSTETYFAGSYFGNGFHEDGFRSAVHLSQLLLGRDPWISGNKDLVSPHAAVA